MKQEQQFIEELQQLLQEEPGHLLTVTYETTFKEAYNQLTPTLHELRRTHNLEENPPGTNTEIILFLTKVHSKWYDKEILSKQHHNPKQELIKGLDNLFNNNNKYTSPTGKTIYYYKGHNQIPRIKQNIIQEFDLRDHKLQPYEVKYILRTVETRFT